MKYIYITLIILLGYENVQCQNLSVSFSKSEQACTLAEASVTIISGTQPISFLWSNGSITNKTEQLNEGNYSVTINIIDPFNATGFPGRFINGKRHRDGC